MGLYQHLEGLGSQGLQTPQIGVQKWSIWAISRVQTLDLEIWRPRIWDLRPWILGSGSDRRSGGQVLGPEDPYVGHTPCAWLAGGHLSPYAHVTASTSPRTSGVFPDPPKWVILGTPGRIRDPDLLGLGS